MNTVERGVKRRCGKCETPFYDLLRDPIRCPKCGSVLRVEAAAPRPASAARLSKARGVRAKDGASRSSRPIPSPEVLGPFRIDADKARADDDADRDDADKDADEAETDSENGTDDDQAAGGEARDDR